MIRVQNSNRKRWLIVSALLVFCLFWATLSDAFVHSAHAGHDHDPHDRVSVEMMSSDFEEASDLDNSKEPQGSFNDKAPDTFSHGCLVFIVPSPDAYVKTDSQMLRRDLTVQSLTSRLPTRLERPPRHVS
jgi:hypothetical protein